MSRKLTVTMAGTQVRLYGHPPLLLEIARQLEKPAPKRVNRKLDVRLRDRVFGAA